MYKVIFFDCDDTLVKTMELHYKAFAAAFAEVNISLEKEYFLSLAGMTGLQIIEHVLENSKENPLEIYKRKQEIFKTNNDEVKPIKNTMKLLEVFGEKFTIAIVSGSHRNNVEKIVKQFNLKVDYILAGSDFKGKGKPYPDIYLQAMRDLQVKPHECIGFEDSNFGMTSLKDAGIFPINVKDFYN